MASANAVSIWPEIREKIERQTTPQQFATWFRNLALEEVTDSKVVFSVPSRFHRDWIVTYYREHVERAVAEVLGSPRPIHLDVVPRDPAEAAPPRRPARSAAGPGEGVAAPTARATPPPAGAPRVAADLPLTEGFDFESFVVGGCNQLAAAAGHCLAQSAACDFELLLVVGGPGLGKTHLLQAIARAAMAQRPQRSVAYVRAENFVHDFMQVMGTGDAGKSTASTQFRDKWRRLDFVCFDDLHLLAGKLGTQQELLHTLNAWHDRGTRVVFAANGAPGDNLNLDPGLLARISGAFRVNLRMPDLDTRRELVLSKSKARAETLPEDVVSFLAELPASTVRELEGALTGVVAGSRLTGTPLTLRSARLALQDDTLLQRPASSPDRILKAVCLRFEVTVADLCSPRRPQALSFARQCGMYLLRERTELSLSEIGALLGGRDHTTILHGIRKVEESIAVDSRVRDHLARLRQLLER
ncbi:MAG TPA: chromosomal replication initiator protein DnaA [Planctomycetota bacterium]|nr:chromosomal replication initiator protein DnaA [Planctomycetota bacterium]